MKRLSIIVCCFVLIASLYSWFGGNLAGATENYEIVREESYEVSPGVYHQSLEVKEGQDINSLQLLEVDPSHSFVDIRPYTSNGEVYGLETVGNTIDELWEQGERVVGGVNGDFFSSVGVPSGLQIVDGEIYTSPRSIKALMLIYPDNTVELENTVQMTAEITSSNGEKLELDMVNRSRVASHNDRAFLFNYRFGPTTKSPDGGIEVIVDVGEGNDQLRAGQTIEGVIESIEETSDSSIERGKLVLSAVGTKADWILSHMPIGSTIKVDINFTKDVNEAKHALSGNSTLGTVLLKDGEIWEDILDESNSNNTAKHPRTMLATKDGKLYILSVDGRQPGHSDGMTLPGAARYLQSLGMEHAINIDGGGSATYYVRQPGENKPTLMNRPSDGHERPVGNSLLIVSKAPETSKLAGIRLYPTDELRVVSGSSIRLHPKGYDQHTNPVAVEPKSLNWSVEGQVGTIDRSGLFTASEGNKDGQIVVEQGAIQVEKSVSVTDQVAALEISPSSFVLEPGKLQEFFIRAYDDEGEELIISSDVVDWSVEGDIGVVSDKGVFKAGSHEGIGKVVVRYGDVVTEAIVEVGPNSIIEDFEDESHIRGHEVRTVPGSVEMTLVSDPEFVLFGDHSARLTYDFTGTAGTSAAYVQFLDDEGNLGQEIKGEPKRLGVWVYGDSKYHHLRLGITDGNGNSALWNMTTIGGVNWTGWKYVYATVPADTVFPIKVRYFALEEKNQHNKTAGVLYYDQFEAEYTVQEHQPNIGILLQRYIEEGSIQHPIAKQLTNKLKEAERHLNNGSRKQFEKFIGEFLELVNNPGNDQWMTKEARIELNRKVIQSYY